LKVGEGTWFVEVNYNQRLDYGWFTKGWEEFMSECKVRFGDTILFEMIDVQNHVLTFWISHLHAKKTTQKSQIAYPQGKILEQASLKFHDLPKHFVQISGTGKTTFL
jgi:hypothetical protein